MRQILLCGVLLSSTVVPASAQLRLRDFGFDAAMAMHGRAPATPQVGGSFTVAVQRHGFELAGGSAAGNEFVSLSSVWYHGVLNVGAGPALHASATAKRPALAGRVALDIPFAPRKAAAVRVVARVIAVSGGPRWSVGAGVQLAPFNGGIRLGEGVAVPLAPADAARSWKSIVAQVMLLDDGSTCLEDVMATPTALSVRFAPASQAEVMRDVARVARILTAGIDVHRLVIRGPDPSWVRAAATAGGFPAERIMSHQDDGMLTIQATRALPDRSVRSARP